MDENKTSQTRLKTISYDKINIKRKSNLRDLQLDILDSLTKGPIVDLKKRTNRKIGKNPSDNDYESYNTKILNSLNKYQLSIIHDKDKDEPVDRNDLGPNKKYII